LSFAASKPGATFECELDAAAGFTACATPLLLTDLALGSHVFRVRSRDPLGNLDPAPPSYTWTIVAPPVQAAASGCSTGSAAPASVLAWIAAASLARGRRRRRRV
jgi:uncharacterized protein (TIGR03382 family)